MKKLPFVLLVLAQSAVCFSQFWWIPSTFGVPAGARFRLEVQSDDRSSNAKVLDSSSGLCYWTCSTPNPASFAMTDDGALCVLSGTLPESLGWDITTKPRVTAMAFCPISRPVDPEFHASEFVGVTPAELVNRLPRVYWSKSEPLFDDHFREAMTNPRYSSPAGLSANDERRLDPGAKTKLDEEAKANSLKLGEFLSREFNDRMKLWSRGGKSLFDVKVFDGDSLGSLFQGPGAPALDDRTLALAYKVKHLGEGGKLQTDEGQSSIQALNRMILEQWIFGVQPHSWEPRPVWETPPLNAVRICISDPASLSIRIKGDVLQVIGAISMANIEGGKNRIDKIEKDTGISMGERALFDPDTGRGSLVYLAHEGQKFLIGCFKLKTGEEIPLSF